ncbi:MAG: hypothetical protein KF784_05790 [Fimbriimonadaceae bacterium]|nr:hypothetical protein [Fimbriimonadaceae bacterium]
MRNKNLIVSYSAWQHAMSEFGPLCIDVLLGMYRGYRLYIQEKHLQGFTYYPGDPSEGATAITEYLQRQEVIQPRSFNETFVVYTALMRETNRRYHAEDIWTYALAVLLNESDVPGIKFLTTEYIYGIDEAVPQILFGRDDGPDCIELDAA